MPEDFDNFFIPAGDEHVSREKAKAREMRKSQWWKNIKGRGKCHYCDADVHPSELTMDHVVPIIRGGFTTRGNVVPACKTCNSQKKYLLPIEWQTYLDKQAAEARARK
jgi:5-methylcytosine-specific restriction endonuclease McrA